MRAASYIRPRNMAAPMRRLATAVSLLLASACGSAPADPDAAAAAPGGAAAGASAGASGTAVPGIGADPEARRVGALIQQADTHLRSWHALMGRPRDAGNLEDLQSMQFAIAAFVVKHRAMFEDQAIGGPPRNRGIATAILGFCGDATVLPILMNNAADADPQVAAKALLSIGVLGSPDTPVSPLLMAVERPDATEELTSNAAFALFRLADRLRADPDGGLEAGFLLLLRSPDASVRAQAALGLGLVRASAAVPQITDLLAADPLPAVRTAAAWSLGLIGMRGSTEPLIRALADPDEVTAGTARGALTRIHGRDYGPAPASWRAVEGQ